MTDRLSRIVFIAGQMGLGGAEQQLYNLISHLDRQHFRSLVLNLGSHSSEFWATQISKTDTKVIHIGRRFGRLGRVVHIAKILRHYSPEIVHSWDFHTNPYAAVAGHLAGVPIRIGSLRSSFHTVGGGFLVKKLGSRDLDVIVANSLTAQKELQANTHVPVHHIPNGVCVASATDSTLGESLRATLILRKPATIIGTIGRLDENKNHGMLIHAFSRLARQHPSLHLLIIGGGPLHSKLLTLVDSLDLKSRVTFLGAVPNAASWLNAIDIFCLPSRAEGMPNAVMEALGHGLPVVATSVGGVPNLIKHGSNGFLVEPNNENALYVCLDDVVCRLANLKSVCQLARLTIEGGYSIQRMVSSFTSLYMSQIAKLSIDRTID